ncbi:hypothetical protein T02_14620 [Trichinella nativa]|uniref:Uncharacterized protein n=1 Tax=Trichinella nativa TaxID=6335 RepID=A0A0V1L7B4_9BILA|nr:hypothetical protein T02_14620 [Trichinella nativa]
MNVTPNVLSLTKSLLLGIVLRDRITIMGHFSAALVSGEFTFVSAVHVLVMEIHVDNINIALLKADLEATFPRCVLSASTTTTSSSSGSSSISGVAFSGSNSNTISSSSGSSGISIYMSTNCCP